MITLDYIEIILFMAAAYTAGAIRVTLRRR